MPSFGNFFIESEGKPFIYKDKLLHLVDFFPVNKEEELLIKIESTNSEYFQGFSLSITGKCEFEGDTYQKGKGIKMIFWQDRPIIQIKVTSKRDFIVIQNVWKNITPQRQLLENSGYVAHCPVNSGYNGAAMIIEEIENGRRYYCNDGHPDENFDDIVFTVQRVKEK